ncbi:MAG: hybrid sensor histidine kinase/response regulator [Chloroflexi bacterium]|uniref:sensor histidine kinase n=1 Tax=Candidatus Flexifilum breve TaxID=3140694 RepID=UPI0031354FA7|nr:hybrid sensor histidine kinase/response regulator [Chloroflexota bacterium]
MPITLLYVEDDRIDQLAFLSLVTREQLGYTYRLASSVSEAKQLLQDEQFDVIIADFQLGDGTALDILAFQNNVPLIVATGAGNETVAVQAMKAGAYDYLSKDSEQHYLDLLPIVVDNVVARRMAERESVELMRERIRRETLQTFIRDASHDLRTPLTTLKTSLYLLSRYVQQLLPMLASPDTNPTEIYATVIRVDDRAKLLVEQEARLEFIITDMLEMVRVDNLEAIDLQPSEFNYLIASIIQSQQPRAEQNQRSVTFTPYPQGVWVRADPNEMAAIVYQLVKNALDYTPKNGTVVVCVSVRDEEAVLSIKDTGVGIAPEELSRIFNRFYRVDSSRAAAQAGSGLGLAIVKQLVELHHGRIEVESTVGEGSTFRVLLPLWRV